MWHPADIQAPLLSSVMIMRVQVQKYLFQGASKAIFIRGFLILYEILKILSTYQFEHQLWILATHSCLTRYLLLVLYECPANSKACSFTKALLGKINPPKHFLSLCTNTRPFWKSWIRPWCLLLQWGRDATILCTCAPHTGAYTQPEHHSSMYTGQTWTVLGEPEGNWQSCCTAWFENPHPQRLLQCHQIPVSRSSNVTMLLLRDSKRL